MMMRNTTVLAIALSGLLAGCGAEESADTETPTPVVQHDGDDSTLTLIKGEVPVTIGNYEQQTPIAGFKDTDFTYVLTDRGNVFVASATQNNLLLSNIDTSGFWIGETDLYFRSETGDILAANRDIGELGELPITVAEPQAIEDAFLVSPNFFVFISVDDGWLDTPDTNLVTYQDGFNLFDETPLQYFSRPRWAGSQIDTTLDVGGLTN